ncbi:MAG TPA: MBOAT family O-acyltransferase [Anaerolineales bacterium]|nr:MBOAT family O-acyltransferase [Anaerolineales bacterium]
MNFNTPLFLFLFLPFFLIAYFFAQPRWRPVLGIIASLLFYAWGNLASLAWIVGLILFNHWLGLRLHEKPAKWTLPLGLLANAGLLAFFKFFVTYGRSMFFGLDALLPARAEGWLDTLVFPLGLSYISFQLISYLLDVQKGAVISERNLASFAFYILMFPKLLAGPIVRYRTLAETLPAPTLDTNQVADGIRRFVRGFVKKILIADVIGQVAIAAFGLPVEASTPLIAWLGLVGYALQIYYDFSGYTDMAIGLASMMGFRYIENFNHPYIAQSIGDFWRRWHISLSSWFRDYVFYPLERRRLPVIGQPFNILIVFLLTGLWHGVTLNFVVWGLLHGFFIAIEGLFLNRLLQKTPQVLRHVYTLSALLLTWLVFRAPSVEYAREYLTLLMGGVEAFVPLSFYDTYPLPFIEPSFIIAFATGLIFCLPVGAVIQKRVEKSPALIVIQDIVLLALFVLAVGMMASSAFQPGIYEGF